ncbi:glycosyltransferase family 2 protein [Microbacterium hominis]|uniref:glycosyltransferase family 2 protein n=1 Tax=Microbacterium hominis TaxID=162426 RepID=UPI001964C935|nr:glycosyltransferase family 2 protein [Microbacterium hominis]QRY41911.1 glycosyltransferase family 2 protein [Microbacterium hominis]
MSSIAGAHVSVSIILPAYNAGSGFDAALERVLDTCPEDGEIIVVDDGSTDGSADVATAFSHGKPNVSVITMPDNRGVANARNAALERARGDYIWFVDWDDEWSADIVRALLRTARTTDSDIVVCCGRWKSADGLVRGRVEDLPGRDAFSGPEAIEEMLQGGLKGYLWTKLIRRDLIQLPAFPLQRSQSDFCGLTSIVARAQRVSILREDLYWHIVREGSITNSREPQLDNLDRCREAIQAVADEVLPDTSRTRRLKLVYDYEFWMLSRVNTALRLSKPETARAEVSNGAASMRWRELVEVATIRPKTALRSSVVLLLRRAYVPFWRTATGARSRLRRVRAARL